MLRRCRCVHQEEPTRRAEPAFAEASSTRVTVLVRQLVKRTVLVTVLAHEAQSVEITWLLGATVVVFVLVVVLLVVEIFLVLDGLTTLLTLLSGEQAG